MFENRVEAGRVLADRLIQLCEDDVVVLGLPRGGVPVAAEVARRLEAPLDVIFVRKLGVPSRPELALGALGEDDTLVLNNEIVDVFGVTKDQLDDLIDAEGGVLRERARRYRAVRPRVPLRGRTVLLIDDGLATGATARAACRVAKAQGAARLILAVPVAPADWGVHMHSEADQLIALETPRQFSAVGAHYWNFNPVPDEEVIRCLRDQADPITSEEGGPAEGITQLEVECGVEGLPGRLAIPDSAKGLIVFSHGSGSSRLSPRNDHVAGVLNRAGFATLLFDLLTPNEEMDRGNVFNVERLSQRLVGALEWVARRPDVAGLPIGIFGSSTGAAGALRAVTQTHVAVGAAVLRGGRPDLAGGNLGSVEVPTLLIVGSEDRLCLALNRRAQQELGGYSELDIVHGAGHLFHEPGTLDAVAQLARDWFVRHLVAAEVLSDSLTNTNG